MEKEFVIKVIGQKLLKEFLERVGTMGYCWATERPKFSLYENLLEDLMCLTNFWKYCIEKEGIFLFFNKETKSISFDTKRWVNVSNDEKFVIVCDVFQDKIKRKLPLFVVKEVGDMEEILQKIFKK